MSCTEESCTVFQTPRRALKFHFSSLKRGIIISGSQWTFLWLSLLFHFSRLWGHFWNTFLAGICWFVLKYSSVHFSIGSADQYSLKAKNLSIKILRFLADSWNDEMRISRGCKSRETRESRGDQASYYYSLFTSLASALEVLSWNLVCCSNEGRAKGNQSL